MTITTVRATRLLIAVFVLSAVWLAAPQAGQEYGANDGIILFITDRDNPSPRGMCGNCEEIYVMRPDGSNPVRLTSGGADVVVGGRVQQRRPRLVARDKADRVPEQSRRRHAPGIPDETRWHDQRVLLSLEIQRAFGLDLQGTAYPSFSPMGDALCFHSQDTLTNHAAEAPRHLHRQHRWHGPDQPHQPARPRARRRQHAVRLVAQWRCHPLQQHTRWR